MPPDTPAPGTEPLAVAAPATLDEALADLGALCGGTFRLRGPGEPAAAAAAPGLVVHPLERGEERLGRLEFVADERRDASDSALGPSRSELRTRLVPLVAALVGELLEDETQLRHRIAELSAVFRVSAALTGLENLPDILHSALTTVIEVMDVKAGAIRLLEPGSDELVLRATVNLSPAYHARGPIFAGDSELDLAALSGDVVHVPDLRVDRRVRFPDLVESEGLRSFLSAGMIFRGRPVGTVRLYTGAVRQFSAFEKGLLEMAAQQVAAAVAHARLLEDHRRTRQVRRQIRLATSVQQRMLPAAPPARAGLDVAAEYLPSLDLGGDFYDFLSLGSSLGLVVGDVVGKGVPAALLMASVRASLRAHALDLYDLEEVMSRTNRAMYEDTLDREFATLWYGVLDPDGRRLTYCNAGHEPAWRIRRDPHAPGGHRVDSLDAGGLVIGVLPAQRYEHGIIDLRPGDRLLVFTDGLTEAQDFDGRCYGRDRLRGAVLDLLANRPDAGARHLLKHVLWDMRRFVGLHARSDDVTIVSVRVDDPASR